jgi:TPR repeat protein
MDVLMKIEYQWQANMGERERNREEGKKFFEKKEYMRAAISFRKAADEGDAEAQYRLAWMYFEGQGVQCDLAESSKWRSKAADQGHVAALYERGCSEFLVTVEPVDYTQAYKWLTVAASRAINAEVKTHIMQKRDLVAAEMTSAQIADAERLARDWKPQL